MMIIRVYVWCCKMKFGAKSIVNLLWIHLINAYTFSANTFQIKFTNNLRPVEYGSQANIHKIDKDHYCICIITFTVYVQFFALIIPD